MNFGKWIVVAFVLFAMIMATMVVICVRQDVNLVSKDYYERELKHQTKIDQLKNTNELSSPPEFSWENGRLRITFKDFGKIEKGTLHMIRPSSDKLDQEIALTASSEESQLISLNQTVPGLYRVQMEWEMGGKEYMIEKSIVAP